MKLFHLVFSDIMYRLKFSFIALFLFTAFVAFAQEENNRIPDHSDEYELKNLSINSVNSDYGVTYFKNGKIIFSSTRKDPDNSGRRWEGNHQPFLNFYVGDSIVEGDVLQYSSLQGEANSKFHESNCTFNKDRTKVYFTRNTFYENKKGLSSDRIMKLSIYIADVAPDGKWYNIVPFPYNSDEYNNGHPTMSLDGKKLYFSSDMPGTMGNSDVFFCDITGTGTFTVPKSLGGNVNTPGRESFPFIAPDGTLYFSSDGHGGLGKLDIFKTDSNEYELAAVQNIGEPFNSSRDDIAFVLNNNLLEGYFASNRPGGKGDDDIYYFMSDKLKKKEEPVVVEPPKPMECKNAILGTLTDANDGVFLEGGLVEIIDEEGNTVFKSTVGENGNFRINTKCDKRFLIKASKKYYLSEELEVTSSDVNGEEKFINVSLIPEVSRSGGKLVIDIESIYFDYDDFRITKQAAVELDKVIAFMLKYPEVIVEGGSHTDCRGGEDYNLKLSTKRAQSTVKYIMENGGFDSSRISAKGYGESAPVNNCVDGVKCTETEHALNRRTEFAIVNPEAYQ